jgi:hypothetical protein
MVLRVDIFSRRLSQRIDQHVDRRMDPRGTNESKTGVSLGTTILGQDLLASNRTRNACYLRPRGIGSPLGLV